MFSIVSFVLSTLLVYSQTTRQKDSSVVSVSELTDVKGDEWAYKAVQELVEKYDVLEGYPDGTYKGKKPATRFELAACVYDLATYFSEEIALDREDLAKLAKLLNEFSGEIKAIQARVDTLETKVTTLETKTQTLETRTSTLEDQVADHTSKLDEHEKRLAYAERRKGFILERLMKGLVVDLRDLSRGITASILAPFNKNVSDAISK